MSTPAEPLTSAPSAEPRPIEGDNTKPQAPTTSKPRRRRWLRRLLLGVGVGTPVLALALWIAIHRVEWLGPWLADTGRSIVGNDAIAKLEDWAYGVQDEYNQVTRADEKPTPKWEVPKAEVTADLAPPEQRKYPVFARDPVGPMHASFAAPGDGEWVPMTDPRNPREPAPMLKTLLHPDAKRGWSHVAVVAVDLRQVSLHLMAGTMEPMSKLPDAKRHARTGLIPKADVPHALAAFNGGFKATHGHYGMRAEGVTFLEPRGIACTLAAYPGDRLRVASWETLESSLGEMVWFRQAPACMLEGGELHKGLAVEQNTLWGATLDKDTVIRRSAIGLSKDGQTLLVGISEATTALAIAKAMAHAGAHDLAQLDVNWSFPKFVTLEPQDGDAERPVAKAIVKGFEFKEDDYVRSAMTRDFFYLRRKSP
jgi:hypothetical protein